MHTRFVHEGAILWGLLDSIVAGVCSTLANFIESILSPTYSTSAEHEGHLCDSVVMSDDCVALPAGSGGPRRAAGAAAAALLTTPQPFPVRAVQIPALLVIAPKLAHLRPQLLVLAQLHVIPKPAIACST